VGQRLQFGGPFGHRLSVGFRPAFRREPTERRRERRPQELRDGPCLLGCGPDVGVTDEQDAVLVERDEHRTAVGRLGIVRLGEFAHVFGDDEFGIEERPASDTGVAGTDGQGDGEMCLGRWGVGQRVKHVQLVVVAEHDCIFEAEHRGGRLDADLGDLLGRPCRQQVVGSIAAADDRFGKRLGHRFARLIGRRVSSVH